MEPTDMKQPILKIVKASKIYGGVPAKFIRNV